MSDNLYLLFDVSGQEQASLPACLKDTYIPGYSFWNSPLKNFIQVPGECSLPVKCLYYTENDFRIYLCDLAVQFSRDRLAPPHIATGERTLLSLILAMPQFRLRRWIITSEGWDDDDQEFTQIVAEGSKSDIFTIEDKYLNIRE